MAEINSKMSLDKLNSKGLGIGVAVDAGSYWSPLSSPPRKSELAASTIEVRR